KKPGGWSQIGEVFCFLADLVKWQAPCRPPGEGKRTWPTRLRNRRGPRTSNWKRCTLSIAKEGRNARWPRISFTTMRLVPTPAAHCECKPLTSAWKRMARRCMIRWCAPGGAMWALSVVVPSAAAGFISRFAASGPLRRKKRPRFLSCRTIGMRWRWFFKALQRAISQTRTGAMAPSPRYEPPDDPEVLEWWAMTPAQRFAESARLWATYSALGGSLEPEPDWQSPFYFAETPRARPAHGRASVHPVRRRRIQPRHRRRRSR